MKCTFCNEEKECWQSGGGVMVCSDCKNGPEEIRLRRVKSLKDLPLEEGDIEPDYELYTLEGGYLKEIFLKAMHDTKRIYVDDEPHYLNFSSYLEISESQGELLLERHDDMDTYYLDFADADRYFLEHKIYQKVKQ